MALSVRSVASKPASPPQFNSFSVFSPSSIQLFRDGGTIKLEGQLNKSVGATVRMDGRIGSRTQGQFFVTRRRLSGTGAETKMTKDDLKGLQSALKRYLKQHPTHAPAYDLMLKRIATALKGAPVART